MAKGLTPKQEAFIDAYGRNGADGAKAYREVYSSAASPANCAREAKRLLANPKIRPLLDAARKQAVQRVADRYAITEAAVLTELARIGFSDVRNVVRWGAERVKTADGGAELVRGFVHPVASDELTDDTAAAIAEVVETKDGIRIKLHDKRAALVDLGRHLGLFKVEAERRLHLTLEVLVGASFKLGEPAS